MSNDDSDIAQKNIKKILVLSAYDAPSHRYWHQGLKKYLSNYHWTILSLPPRHFNWRVRGNSLTWRFSEHDRLTQHYDLVVATSMVDLACLKGIVPSLAQVPSIVYFHENQFAYPASEHQMGRQEPRWVSLYSAMAATRIVFNTEFNRRTFLSGVEAQLKKMPDCIPVGVVESLAEKASVLPVPIENLEHQFPPQNDTARIVWNHRWEYDKGPDTLLRAVQLLDAKLPSGYRLLFHIVGQQFRQHPAAFAELEQLLERRNWKGCWGYIESREDYIKLLQDSDFVLSTALHDFQGLSVLEAVSAGCRPVLPRRMAYPEFFGECFLYPVSDDQDIEASNVANALINIAKLDTWMVPDVSQYYWLNLIARYESLLDEVCGIEYEC